MEGAQRRRLSIIASHIHPLNPVTVGNSSSSAVSSSKCSDSEKECSNLSSSESDCVFCKIVKGDSPALKVLLFYQFNFQFYSFIALKVI